MSVDTDLANCTPLVQTPQACFTIEDLGTQINITAYDSLCTKSVVIPNTINNKPVTSIDDYAFDGKGIQSIYFPSTIKTIGYAAFRSNSLKSIYILVNHHLELTNLKAYIYQTMLVLYLIMLLMVMY